MTEIFGGPGSIPWARLLVSRTWVEIAMKKRRCYSTESRSSLDCPANNRERVPNSNFCIDYTYNQNLGDIRGQAQTFYNGSPNGAYLQYNPAHAFKKWTQVPGNVLVACDASEPTADDDLYFDTLGELTWKKGPVGGQPHKKQTMGNALFHDGSVRTLMLFKRPLQWAAKTPAGGNINNNPQPTTPPQKHTPSLSSG